MASTGGAPHAKPPPGKSKEEALAACGELHNALVACYKTCGLGTTFTGCCTDEHKAFWECYTRERGTNQTRINSWLDNIFTGGGGGGRSSGSGSSRTEQQASLLQQQQQQQQQQQAKRMEVDLAWLQSVAARHCPAFHLHPRDRFMPCSVEWFFDHCELRCAGADDSVRALLPRGALAAPLLVDAQRQAPPGSRLWLELDPAARGGEPLDALDSVPVYANPKLIVAPDGGVEALEVTYITIYAYNGEYKVGGLSFLPGTGAHDGDIEHLTVRLHPRTGDLIGVWFNAHRPRDGCWVPAREVRRDARSGRIAAYVALHGHGTYPCPGRVHRHFFLGNDLCCEAGPAWHPCRVVLLPPQREGDGCAVQPGATRECGSGTSGAGSGTSNIGHASENGGHASSGASSSGAALPQVTTDDPCEWLAFAGNWGEMPAPARQTWFYQAETPVSRTPLLRVVGHFVPERACV
ncbi:2-Cys peroxiredoxin chloroplastic [Micractinium conductrix]|uniref:2-Cys peroxiredoxin chloroplastic n=1 Tax=Micractinium conductrix TaxID=554055 RepID=A0A2P6VR07_9CHLO|nr:2-Cys peroxiredoxin chloroplastic [Micractinium conductrix]|eukprot:PSC76524.1 2-Cys peroxiredoxin chloroplastic [Micractinium conductrix]